MNQRHPLTAARNIVGIAMAAGLAIAMCGTPAQAQQSELDQLRQTIAQLQARLDKLEDQQKKQAAAPAPTVQTASKANLVISGLLQEQYNAFFSQDNGALAKQNDGFSLRRGELRLTAPHLASKVSGTVMFDVAKTGAIGGNTGRGGSVLQELQVTYDVDGNPKAPKFIDIGQFKPGIGYESDLVSSSALPFTERALMYRFTDLGNGTSGANILNRGGLGDRRDQGARVRGTFEDGKLNYNLGVFNGLGETQNTNAQGDNKAVVGRLYYKDPSGWSAGGSAAKGDVRNVFPVDAGQTVSRLDRTFYNGFLNYKKDKVSFTAEYSNLKSEDQDSPLQRNANGYYASAGYLLSKKWELVARYDRLKEELSSTAGVDTNGVAKEISLGVNYYIKGNNAKIQTDVVRVQGDGLVAGSPVNSGPFNNAYDSWQLRTQYQIAF